MVRIQLHLTEDQNRALRALGRARGQTRAELIRGAIDSLLSSTGSGNDPLSELIGTLGPGPARDVSERHDDFLYTNEPLPVPRVGERRPRKR